MSCKIVYDSQGNKIGVEENNELFQEILNNAQVKDFDSALNIFMETYSKEIEIPRVADKLPLTLSVFDNKSFIEMRGKQVNPITVQQILNGGGIKQIEKDLINQVIEDNYKGQKKISFDELEVTVRANIMPLERITTSSYADYGMDNLGSGNYGEAKTIILNAPIEHGVTGHFLGDFKASGRQNIKYVPKQLNDNVWVAVEEGYESQANDNNIYQYVGTAGTKEVVDEWINNYNKPNTTAYTLNDLTFNITQGEDYKAVEILNKNGEYIGASTFNISITDEEIKNRSLDYANKKETARRQDLNKGMFGHIRVWQDGQDYYVAELQSDYFQKNNARKDLIGRIIVTANEKAELAKDLKVKELKQYKDLGYRVEQINDDFILYKNNDIIVERKEEAKYQSKDDFLNEYLTFTSTDPEILAIRQKNDSEFEKILEKEVFKREQEKLKSLSPQEKQFIASQKIWEQRMVREAIKEASLSGATSLRFPTPYTLSVIEGYVSDRKDRKAPYRIVSSNSDSILEVGDVINYLSEDRVVFESTPTSIKVAYKSNDLTDEIIDDIKSQKDAEIYTDRNKISDKKFFYKGVSLNIGVLYLEMKEVPKNFNEETDFEGLFQNFTISEYFNKYRKEIEAFTGNIFTEGQWENFIEDSDGTIVQQRAHTTLEDATKIFNGEIPSTDYKPTISDIKEVAGDYADNIVFVGDKVFDISGAETLGQPDSYKKGQKETFNISDLSDTQQTVARKYEEIAEILKKEKPVEIVTDKNGFDWYEAPITQADTQSPVVAFSLSQTAPKLKYQTQDGKVFDNYSDALKNTQGEPLQAGVNTTEGFKPIFLVSSNTSIDTTEGFINNMVKSDLLTGENYKENGKTHYKAQGKSFAKQKINAENVKDLYQKQFGIKSATINADNTITINGEETHRTNVQIITKKGEVKTVSLSELNKPFSELKKEYDTQTVSSILANKELKVEMAKNTTAKEEFVPETELQQKLINLLKKFGIKTLSFEEYLKNYSKRNSLPISAKALVDLTEKLIAFKDGIIENDDLVEEVAHLIEASIPMEQKENILRNIHKTQEWMQFAEEYSKIYATEEEVRREILGKVVANSIKEQFANRNSNETENTIIDKIRQFFEEFFNRINNFFKESYRKELEAISKEVYKNLMNETLDLDIKQTGVFFSTGNASTSSTKLFNIADKILNKLEEQHREFSKKYKNTSDKVLLDRTKEYLAERDEALKIKGVANIVRVTSSQVETLLKATENKKDDEYPLSSEENVIFKNLEERVRPALAEVKALLDKKDKFQGDILEELSNTTKKLEDLVGIIKSKREVALDRMVENIIQRGDMSDSDAKLYRETIKNALTDVQKDTDWLHAHIGSLLLARNPILNIAGSVIERMNYQKNENFLKPTKELINFLTDNKFSQKDWEKIIKDGYIINEVDQNKVEQVNKKEKTEILNDLIKRFFRSVNPVTENTDFKTFFDDLQKEFDSGNPGVLLKSLDQQEINDLQSQFKRAWQNNTKKRVEKYFDEAYLKEKESTIVNINGQNVSFRDLSQTALDLDAEYTAETTQIRINAGDNLTKSDQAKIKEVNKRRQADSNPRGIDGKIIDGIKEVYDENLERYVVVLDQYDENGEETDVWKRLSRKQKDDINAIIGLNYISILNQEFYKKKNQGKAIPQSFIDALNTLTTTEEKLEFLENNSYMSFPDSYYEGFKNNAGLVSRLRNNGSEEAIQLVEDIRAQQSIINRVLRINSVFNKPSETNFVEMNEVHKNDIRIAQINLEKLYNDAKGILKGEEVEETDSEVDNVVNDSYYNHLRDSGEDEMEFIAKNVTPNGLIAIETAKKIVAGNRKISKGFAKYFSENMSDQEKQEALLKFAKSKLLPYLKRTEPIGYTKALNDVRSGAISVKEFIAMDNIIKVSPSFSFYEGIDDNINKQWIKNRDENKPQWTKEYLSKVANKEYFDFFNLDERGNRSPSETKNQKYWEAREKILEYQDKMIEYNNLTGVQNRYMQPQVRRTDIERLAGTTVKGVKEFFVDMAQFRPEEQETGRMLSDSLHSIPTYYNQPLEEKEELTKNYLYSYMMYGQAASLYKARKENVSDMFILEDVLTASSFETKTAEATKTYKMFKNFMEYNFYGVKENFSLEFKAGDRTLDVGKILKSLNSFAKKSNLAGLTVPITNLLQSGTQKFMERVIGETMDSKSANEGNKLFMKYASEATKEVMGFNSKSPLNVIGESLGIYNAVHRFEDSQYSKPLRFFLGVNSKLHEAANFPIVMRGVMGIIASYKIVDGKIISYNQFKQKLNALGSKADVASEWEKQEAFAPDFISAVKNGVLDFSDPDFLKRMEKKIIPPTGQTLEQYLNDKKVQISVKSLAFIQRIDSQIPMHQKSIAQRDARANFFLSHLGFLLSAIPQRIRSRHFNLAEETWQEGSWITAKDFLAKVVFNPKGFKEAYANLDENQKKNIKRVLVEMAFGSALAFMALALSRWNDDDNDVAYPMALADLFLTRVATEQISSTTGLPSTIFSVTENPLMVATKIKDWSQLNKLVGTSEERNSYLNKLVPFYKELDAFSDPLAKRKKYVHYQANDESLFYTYAFASRYFKKE